MIVGYWTRRVEMTPDESNEEEDKEPEPKKSMSVDSDEGYPIQPPFPYKLQSWEWDLYYHQRAPRTKHYDPDSDDKMWRCGDPPATVRTRS